MIATFIGLLAMTALVTWFITRELCIDSLEKQILAILHEQNKMVNEWKSLDDMGKIYSALTEAVNSITL